MIPRHRAPRAPIGVPDGLIPYPVDKTIHRLELNGWAFLGCVAWALVVGAVALDALARLL